MPTFALLSSCALIVRGLKAGMDTVYLSDESVLYYFVLVALVVLVALFQSYFFVVALTGLTIIGFAAALSCLHIVVSVLRAVLWHIVEYKDP
jgi:hypothetical protein